MWMKRLRTLALSGLLISLAFLASGCWDRKEIENRGYVLGVAIDYVVSPAPKGQYDLSHVTQETGQRKYRVTVELPKFRKVEGEKSTGGPEQHLIFVGEGESLLAITRAIDAKTYFALFFEDTQIVVFSEAVARDGIKDLIDFFVRTPGMRRRVKMFVTPGRAEDILKGKMQVAEVNSSFIAKITRNDRLLPRFATNINLGDVSEAIRNERAFVMDEILLENGEVKLTKGKVFNKDTKLVGETDEWETIGAKIIRKNLKGGVFTVPNPANPEKLAAFDLLESRYKINSHLDGERLWFTVEAEFVGNLGENAEPEQDALDPAFLAALEQELADEFTRQVLAAYHKLQTLKADPIGLASLVHRQHPQYWKKVKDRWDEEIFPTVPVDVKIKVSVRRPGMVR